MICTADWFNIAPYWNTSEFTELRKAYCEKFNSGPDWIYLPHDATLEQYLNDVRNALETGVPLSGEHYYADNSPFAKMIRRFWYSRGMCD